LVWQIILKLPTAIIVAMHSNIAEALKLRTDPVAILWTNERPEGALGFKGRGAGCALVLLAQAASRGRTAAFDRENFGCMGAGTGLGFGMQQDNFPLGGVEAFKYFLSTGLEDQGRGDLLEKARRLGSNEMRENFLKGEGYKKTPDLVVDFLMQLPVIEVPTKYVVFKPLRDLDEQDEPIVMVFVANSDQISALVGLANYDRPGIENVVTPMGAGCHQICIAAYREAEKEKPRAVLGLTDPSARKNVRPLLGSDVFTFAIPYKRFLEMEACAGESFLSRSTWKSLAQP
jgi:uncharacterized protein (DUF169 family)